MSANLNPSTLDESLSEAAGRESEILARLKSALKNMRLVIVVGAGVTLSATADVSGRPLSRITWTGLMRNGFEYLVNNGYVEASNRRTRRAYEALEDLNTDSLLDAANILGRQLKQHCQFLTWLESIFGNLDQEIRHPAILETLKVLHEKGATFLTTNYDDLLEKYCSLRRIGRSNRGEVLKFKRGDLDGVFHVYGSYHDPHEVMLDTTDYYEMTHSDEVQNMLKTFLEFKTMVFIGCGSGLEDPNFDALLKWASEWQKNILNRHCLLIRNGDNLKCEQLVRLKYGPGYQDLAPFLNKLLDEAPRPAHVTVDNLLPVQNINLGSSTSREYQDYTVGWICALPTEMAAAVGMLDERHSPLRQDPFDQNTYTLGRIGGHNVVLACLPAGVTGTISAARVASQMTSTFKGLRFGLMVGIGGGVPSEETDIRLGDVVVSKPSGIFGGVIQYDFGKTVQDGRFERTGLLNKPPEVLLTALANLQAKHIMESHELVKNLSEMLARYPKMRTQFAYPGTQHDWLYEADYDHIGGSTSCSQCDPDRLTDRESRLSEDPVIHYGLIASGNQIMRHGLIRDRLRKELDVLCFEMEAAGLMDNFPCLIVRGICDYADSHKNKRWQAYAAATAAAYAKELLCVIAGNQIADTPPMVEVTKEGEPTPLSSIPSLQPRRSQVAPRFILPHVQIIGAMPEQSQLRLLPPGSASSGNLHFIPAHRFRKRIEMTEHECYLTEAFEGFYLPPTVPYQQNHLSDHVSLQETLVYRTPPIGPQAWICRLSVEMINLRCALFDVPKGTYRAVWRFGYMCPPHLYALGRHIRLGFTVGVLINEEAFISKTTDMAMVNTNFAMKDLLLPGALDTIDIPLQGYSQDHLSNGSYGSMFRCVASQSITVDEMGKVGFLINKSWIGNEGNFMFFGVELIRCSD